MKSLIIKCKPEASHREAPHEKSTNTRENERQNAPKLTVRVPSPFPYESDNAVPWVYDVQSLPSLESSNIIGIGGMTRSGCVYTPKDLGDKSPKGKDKEEGRTECDKEDEFLQFIRQSEYCILNQLNHTPAKITLLSLIMSSEPHQKALLKVLNEAYVAHHISQDKFEGIVSHLTANDHLTFTDDEIPNGRPNHNKPLHISVKCKDFLIAKVLVDNGSSLNVLPKGTFDKLMVEEAQMQPSNMIVRAFDGSRREIMGEVVLPIQVGPTVFNVEFQVMDIAPAYSCLLGRPWIHQARAVPSTLHQKVKFVVDNKMVVVKEEEDMIISKPLTVPYVDAAEEALETAFQALEIAHVEKNSNKNPAARILFKNGYRSGQGLGKSAQGAKEFPNHISNPGRRGLGYEPTTEPRKGGTTAPALYEIFQSA
ncbi:uncharacterized protein LOC109794019, partial [Cajanus cajan]|uniref:uncharacterized protein LOC109794019 n=1 Tax=Cajanus cajan TaxID=3821 RepID=UPI00098DAC74